MIKKEALYKPLIAIVVMIVMINLPVISKAQVSSNLENFKLEYNSPAIYEIGDINFIGISYLEPNVLLMLSGLNIGDKIQIPGEDIAVAIKKLWKQGLAENIKVEIIDIQDDKVFLNFIFTEKPRLSDFSFVGINRSETTTITDKINLTRGSVVTDYLLSRVKNAIIKHYIEKGFLDVDVDFKKVQDTTLKNAITLQIIVDKSEKVKIYKINVIGNEKLSDNKALRALKETKEKGNFNPLGNIEDLIFDVIGNATRFDFAGMVDSLSAYADKNLKMRIFKASKFIKENYAEDKIALIEKYNSLGFRDAKIIKDSIYKSEDHGINIDINVYEGPQYYFRNITWSGNTIYSSDFLSAVLSIRKGDIYNKELLGKNLTYNPNGIDVSALYMNNGYLFFQADPVEVLIDNDSIDIEIRIREGKQARIKNVTIKGNTRTNDHVAMREIRTRPGQLFDRELLIRTQRELAQLRYFDPETLSPNVMPNPSDNTVDIEYKVDETSSDQFELSGGWGYGRVIGTFGLSFNNFSIRNVFKKNAWRPVPSGDGQKLALRFQTYGRGYFNYSASFTEPWFGGKKPNSFSISYYHSMYSNGLKKGDEDRSSFATDGMTFGLGKRLTWPDDFFTLMQAVNMQLYKLDNYGQIFMFGSGNGTFNNFNYSITLGRNSVSAPIYPRSGSELSLSLELTPPYSLLNNKDYSILDEDEKFKWIEYYKWKFSSNWYIEIFDKLVLSTRVKFGFLETYNKSELDVTPFGRFYLGGDGLSNQYNLDGREIIAMRGYTNESVTPDYYKDKNIGGTIYSKYTLELRYPLSLNPSATIYGMVFLEAGNAWNSFKTFDPFNVKRSAGVGIRFFMPMFGLLGLDWGYGFDEIPGLPDASGSQFHFSINQSID